MTENTHTPAWKKYYNDYHVGIFSIFIAILMPFILPNLGNLLSIPLYICAMVLVIKSGREWYKIALWVIIPTVLLYLFWKPYLYVLSLYIQAVFGTSEM